MTRRSNVKRWKSIMAIGPIAGLVMWSGHVGAATPSTPRTTPGYWLATGFGSTYAFNVPYLGAQLRRISQSACANGGGLANPAIPTCFGISATSDGQGYWLGASDYIVQENRVFWNGSAYPQGATGSCNSATGMPNYDTVPIVGIAAAPVGAWIVDSLGEVISLCHAPVIGSMGAVQLNEQIVGMAATPDGQGYWLVAADGGVFSFGAAAFYGSMGNTRLNRPVVGMATTSDGKGYWLVARDGGVFAFGDARFSGSMGGKPLARPMVGIAANPDGSGYWTVAQDGGVFAFGDAPFLGSASGQPLDALVVGITSKG